MEVQKKVQKKVQFILFYTYFSLLQVGKQSGEPFRGNIPKHATMSATQV
jgi:hypothetical protein